jgi:hypothetical protein
MVVLAAVLPADEVGFADFAGLTDFAGFAFIACLLWEAAFG